MHDPIAVTQSWVIYALRDPNTQGIRYVGWTKNVVARFKSHLNAAKHRPRYHVHFWIAKLLRANTTPILEILENGNGPGWQAREQFWIAHMRTVGCDLTNLTKGGDGARQALSEATKLKLSKNAYVVLSTRWKDPVQREQQAEVMRQNWKKHKELYLANAQKYGADKNKNFAKGPRNANAKLTEDDVREIRTLLANIPIGVGGRRPAGTMLELGKKFGVNRATIHRIATKGWQHVA